jgi:alkaline phosphatase
MLIRTTLSLILGITLCFSNSTFANEQLLAKADTKAEQTASQIQVHVSSVSDTSIIKASDNAAKKVDNEVDPTTLPADIVAPITNIASKQVRVSTAPSKPKNMVIMIGDGMGPAYTSAYRYFQDDPRTSKVEKTIFDQLLVGMASTYSNGTQEHHNRKTYITDSAASATALSTGVKTYNQAVGLDINNRPLKTLMEYAKELGKKTGLVVTSQINHATPASFISHNPYRYNYDKIADDFFDNRIDGQFIADLMFGGGIKYFIRPDRDLTKQFIGAGYQYFDRYDDLRHFNRLPALGLFATKGMEFAIDSKEKFRLRAMVKKALKLLTNDDQGFFLLVEGSMIDWCGHDNDIGCAMREVEDLAETAALIKRFIDDNPGSLMVMTADHNTGGLSIGSDDKYLWKTRQIRQIKHSMNYVTKHMLTDRSTDLKILWQNLVGIDIDKLQIATISNARNEAIETIKKNRNLDEADVDRVIAEQRIKLGRVLTTILSQNTFTGWTSVNHTGGDVQVFAYGQKRSSFIGHLDNTDIANHLFELMKH